MNESDLILIPKLKNGETGFASEVRPINITNGENRSMTNAVRYFFEEAMNKWVSQAQRGFLPGRDMLHNIVEIDTNMKTESMDNPEAMAAVLDFQAAFLSLCHGFLLEVL